MTTYNNPIQDTINVQFTLSEHIVSDSVKVSVNVELAIRGEEAVNVREQITSSLKGVIDKEWAFSSLNRDQDSTGLERISAVASVRVSESEVNGISVRAKSKSSPGMQITVLGVDYSPTQKKIDETVNSLRKKIYEKATEELTLLNDTMSSLTTSGIWRLNNVQFGVLSTHDLSKQYSGRSISNSMSSTLYNASASSDSNNENLDLTQKISLTGSVTFARLVNL